MSYPVLEKGQVDTKGSPLISEVVPSHAKFQIVRDAVVNYSSTLISGMVGIVMVPILLRALGTESYGLWITALMLSSLIPLDLGLGWSLAREISADQESESTVRFVNAAAKLLFQLGILGAIAISALGFPLSRGLHLSNEYRQLAIWVFCFVGISLLGDQMLSFVLGVLHGLRRFGAANIISISVVLLRAAGSVALIYANRHFLDLVFWQAIVPLVVVLFAVIWINVLQPKYRLWNCFRLGQLDIPAIRSHLPFGIASQFTTSATNWIWQSTPFLVGLLRGPSAIVPFYVGQKFPLAISLFNWRAAEPMYPATSEANDAAGIRHTLELGTRWILMISLPLCTVLFVLGPNLMSAWLGSISDAQILILRVTTVAALADAVGVGALHVLWALGDIKSILRITLGMVLSTILFTALILIWFEPHLAVWAILMPITIGSVLFLQQACRKCGTLYTALLKSCFGILFSSIVCGTIAYICANFVNGEGWISTVLAGVTAFSVYAVSIYFFAATQEERSFARSLLQRS